MQSRLEVLCPGQIQVLHTWEGEVSFTPFLLCVYIYKELFCHIPESLQKIEGS